MRGALAILALLPICTITFAQSRAPGGAASPGSAAGSNPGTSRDAATNGSGDTASPEVKSIDQLLRDYPKLTANLQNTLPSDLTPQQACSGFKTLEQCVITIHAAQNLNLKFPDLKAKTTGKGSISLQKAIEQMAAGTNAKDELKKAKKQASEDMKGISLFG